MKKKQPPYALAGTMIVLTIIAFIWWRSHGDSSDQTAERAILYYQDSMHPWIKSDQPGKCTVCSMDLTPIYEGEQGSELGDDTIVLSRSSVTVLNVQTEEVRRQPLVMTVRVSGTLEADETRKTVFASPSVGRIESMEVEYAGVEVEVGQRLLTFYSPELVALRRQYVVRGNSIVSLSQTTPLGTREGRQAASGLPKLGSRLTGRLGPSENVAETDPYYCDLLAPQSGTVVDRNVFPGQYVAEGEPIFTIVDMSVLWFRFDVYERQLPWLREGQELRVSVSGAPGRDFRAIISWIEPTVDEKTRTAKVRADVVNPREEMGDRSPHLLKLGMYADGWIQAEVPDVVSVPRTGILFPGGRAYAYVERSPGAYTMRPVKLGRQGDSRWEVLDGLEVGDRVVTAGNVLIDAQAQFTHSPATEFGAPAEDVLMAGMSHPAEGGMTAMAGHATAGDSGVPPVVVSFRPEQTAALSRFFQAAGGISAALAADDLKAMRVPVGQLNDRVADLKRAFGDDHPWHEMVERVVVQSDWPEVNDLKSAREVFLPFSIAVVDLVQHVRAGHPELSELKVYYCPMAPGLGLWLQENGPLANPFYGAEMLRCGEEVEIPASLLAAVKSYREAEQASGMETMSQMTHATQEHAMPATVSMSPAGAGPSVVPSHVDKESVAGPADTPSRTQARPRWEPTQSYNSRSPERMDRLEAVAAARLTQRRIDQQSSSAAQQESAEMTAMHQMQATVGDRLDAKAASAPAASPSTTSSAVAELTEEQRAQVQAVIAGAARLSEALAADDLPAYNIAVAELPVLASRMVQVFPGTHSWHATVQSVAAVSQLTQANTLDAARKQFLIFSTRAVELGKSVVRSAVEVGGVKFYYCPMAPKPGVWLQTSAPLRNPYFGAKMLECGEEIAL